MKGKDLKPHIGIFGRRNNGKSSFINVITGQEVAIVSDVAGTTTDPVKKSMEIFGIGPSVIIDTAGIDDTGELGEKRISKTLDIIKQIDCAIIILANNLFGKYEINLIKKFNDYNIPFIIVHNKSDIEKININTINEINKYSSVEILDFSIFDKTNHELFIQILKKTIPETAYQKKSLIGGLVQKGDIVMLITPIDSEVPEGRMILPQTMALRDVLDNDCIAIVLKETELEYFFKTTKIKPKLAITDSQAFGYVNKIIPKEIPLTGFSIVYARMRGPFEKYLEGTPKLNELKNNDKVLILESCTHQLSCEDIGRYKIPNWIKEFTKKDIKFDIVPGLSNLPSNINDYAMVIQCGGCMLTSKQIHSRLKEFIDAGIPVSNYGMVISFINGMFGRATAMFRK